MLKRILIADDDLALLKQVSNFLSGQYTLILSKTGALALRICEQEAPDLLLLDIDMPDMSGFTVMEKLKAASLSHIPVIVLTGDRTVEAEIQALEAGAVDFICKPVHQSVLLHRIALHIQLAACRTQLEQTIQDLENSIIISFAELIECKDRHIGAHLMRTSRYMEIIGNAFVKAGLFPDELSESSVRMMARAMPFHDIGKIGVSDVFLHKTDSLTKAEYDAVKQHTLVGGRIISDLYKRIPTRHYLKYAQLIAQGHHEHYDGGGYPFGLAGDNIPLCSRIAAVVNVYDGCRTPRPYRRAMDHEDACKVIEKGAGSQFDPRIVQIFNSIKDDLADQNYKLQPLFESQMPTG
jgi:putative two-component system response regulator